MQVMAVKKFNDPPRRVESSVRLNKFIADSGYCSRRNADELIKDGRVSVNGKTVIELGTKVNTEKDKLKIDGELVKVTQPRKVYILLNKPRGYITSTSDEKNRPTVLDLIKIKERVYPVGRLDYDSEGLLLLTNDGELANKLMHPKFGVEKTYEVKLNKPIDTKGIERLSKGVFIDGKRTSLAKVKIVRNTENKVIQIIIHEGRNRQVRKMLEAVGLFVRRLKRTEYAGLKEKDLEPGRWRYLSSAEMAKLNKSVQLSSKFIV